MYDTFPNDGNIPIVDYGAVRKSVPTQPALGGLREEAVSAQRMVVVRMLNDYVQGRMEVAAPEMRRKRTAEKQFRIPKLIEWVSGDPDMVVEALSAGRVRSRLSARMGLGKSVRLPSFVANALSMRVLHVAVDAFVLQQSAVYVEQTGLGRVSRTWPTRPGPKVCCMTYADFNGYMATSRRSELYDSFDLIIFDEAFVASADVYAAKAAFAVYANQTINLLLCSATIRSDVKLEEAGSDSLGNFKQITTTVSIADAVASGKLVSEYLVDRSVIFVCLQEEHDMLLEHYQTYGVDCRSITDSALYEEFNDACCWLQGESVTPRVLIADVRFGLGYNMPVGYCIISPYRACVKYHGDLVITEREPLTAAMIAQLKSRTGRGLVDESGGIVLSNQICDSDMLPETEKMEAFVKMCAASIEPLRTPMWKSCYAVFPDGLTSVVAHNILKIGLPVQIVAKYLGSDGCIASKYTRALTCFAHPDHFPMPSVDELPTSFDSWVDDVIAFGEEESDGTEIIKVPYIAQGELKVILHAVEFMSRGLMDVPRWRPLKKLAFNDGYDSDEEGSNPRFRNNFIKLKRIEEKPVVAQTVERLAIPWSYTAVSDPNRASVRRGGFIDSDRCKQALQQLEASLQSYRIPEFKIDNVVEIENAGSVAVVVEARGDVESPGGSVVCTLPVKTCETMNVGKPLTPHDFTDMIGDVRKEKENFVNSKMFDAFSGPWDSILDSLVNPEVLSRVVKKGIATDTYVIVDLMRNRFAIEVVNVFASSNVLQKRYLKLFTRTPSVDDLMKKVSKGEFDRVAQTRGFLDRIVSLKGKIDSVLLYAESQNQFLPMYITSAQRVLPLHGRSEVGRVGDGMVVMPKRARNQILKMNGPLSRISDSGW